MRILAIDPGTKTGWAFSDGERVTSGVNTLKLRPGEAKSMRYIRFKKWFDDMLIECAPVQLVIYEMPHMQGLAATEFLMNLVGRIKEVCDEYGVPFTDVHSGTLKKFTAGHGKASKAQMMKLALDRFGVIVATDDEADALHMLAYAREIYEPTKEK